MEYSISRTFANSADSEKRHRWCDGIMLPEIGEAYHIQHSNADNQEEHWINARAWITEGKTKARGASQQIYTVNVILGEQAWASYQAGKDLRSCVPSEVSDEWIGLDIRRGHLIIMLL
ncbi:MAG: hypothetical protein ACRYF0_08175 [Janthinobacterium lividum]